MAANLNGASQSEIEKFEAKRLAEIADALAISTHDLSSATLGQVEKLVQALATRIAAEAWGRKMGWRVRPYGTPEWRELFTAWLESDG